MAIAIDFLEMHIIHFCNFKCSNCDHYSNYGHTKKITIADIKASLETWSKFIKPRIFKILGGEPTLHPNLIYFISLVRTYFPETRIQLVSNGSFLHKHPSLPELLAIDKNLELCISLHHESEEYNSKMKPVHALLKSWILKHGIVITFYNSSQYWVQRYNGHGSEMQPYEDNQPEMSWRNCLSKGFYQLYNNSIYKCAPLAYLNIQHSKFSLSHKWDRYLNYRPLELSSSIEEMILFFDKTHEDVCAMCPKQPQNLILDNPF